MQVESIPRPSEVELIDHLTAHVPSKSLEPGLALLFQAREYACKLNQDPWEFAVEIEELKSSGMTVNDLRWLLIGGFVEHAREDLSSDEAIRKFKGHGRHRFSRRSCFVLTKNGMGLAAKLLSIEPHCFHNNARKAIEGPSIRPRWDPIRHELSLNGNIVKRFKQHSPNQEAVLMAFEEENWPPGVLDPLGPIPNQDAKQRLRDTIKNLNRHQLDAHVHFSGDGSGERILWDVVDHP